MTRDQLDTDGDPRDSSDESQATTRQSNPDGDVTDTDDRMATRRRVLAAGGLTGAAALAGCLGGNTTATGTASGIAMSDFRGSGPLVQSRPKITAPSMRKMPKLSGELTIYLGGGEGGLYGDLLKKLKNVYPEFNPVVRPAGSAEHANTIIEEMKGGASPADVFWSIEAGSLARVAEAGYTTQLPKKTVTNVPKEFRPGRKWVGVAGRARAVPYNTNKVSAGDIPSKVKNFPGADPLQNAMGWAPSYGAFQAFITAMRLMRGRQKTKRWLNRMMNNAIKRKYPDEFVTSNAVAEGELTAGFANHYYALRVKSARKNAPLDLAFTSGDAGALINTAGAAVIQGTDNETLAKRFVRHLLSAEAQEFFATRTFAYPMVPGVPPVGGLPTIDQLNPPSLSLQKLSDIEPTIELLEEVGAL